MSSNIFLFFLLLCITTATDALCPSKCSCTKDEVNCRKMEYTYFPSEEINDGVLRIDFSKNNLTVIRKTDLSKFTKLVELNLISNQISTIEMGSFDFNRMLEKLLLSKNQLQRIPENLFIKSSKLQWLDLSHNEFHHLLSFTFNGASLLRSLKLHNNKLLCISSNTFNDNNFLEVLTLSQNNLKYLPSSLSKSMTNLIEFSLNGNPLHCDCSLSWLLTWLQQRTGVQSGARCSSPSQYRNRLFTRMRTGDLCRPEETLILGHNDRKISESTQICDADVCPYGCACTGGHVSCTDGSINSIPTNLATDTVEINIKMSRITYVPSKAFSKLTKLTRIDLSDNKITEISDDAFRGISQLESVILYSNRISQLPRGLFFGLTRMQLLLLNANNISCVHEDTFRDQKELFLLSLYDNHIQSLANGTFAPLKNLQTLHLGENPLICDCNMRWMANLFKDNRIEQSNARCRFPSRMAEKVIANTKPSKFKCRGSEYYRTKYAGSCLVDRKCPKRCKCSSTQVDCSYTNRTQLPEDIPKYTTVLNFQGNFLSILPSSGFFERFSNLEILDLSYNKIHLIEYGAFAGAEKLRRLDLKENQISHINRFMFKGLTNLDNLDLRSNEIECINSDTFPVMPSLEYVSLYGNKIRCIQKDAFSSLTKVVTLNLLENPYHCNCHMQWFQDWLVNTNIRTGTVKCNSPKTYNDFPITSMKAKKFLCNMKQQCGLDTLPCCSVEPMNNIKKECDVGLKCPRKCHCQNNRVDCSRRGFTHVPKDINPDTKELHLRSNFIREVKMSDFAHLKNLRVLDLSSNSIQTLTDYVFANLTKLDKLILNFNKLQCIGKHTFTGLKHLQLLSLHGNDISTLPFGSFRALKTLRQLALANNPLYCDCNLKWFSDYVKYNYVESGTASCIGPGRMSNQLVLTTSSENFVCESKPDPRILAKCNACFSYPCHNAGTCRSVGYKNFTCQCSNQYHGKRCEHRVDACFADQCMNGATCKETDAKGGRFTCQCAPGFTGTLCETNIDDCEDSLCQNNSTCVDEIEKYRCECSIAWTGRYCENKVNFCVDYDPCLKGSTCENLGMDYKCHCLPGYTGKSCSEDVNDCLSHNCKNGATCVDDLNNYVCKCPTGFGGRYCEVDETQLVPYLRSSFCKPNTCINGGHCVDKFTIGKKKPTRGFECKCVSGFTGVRCEWMTSVGFRETDSYVRFAPLDATTAVNITLYLSTKQDYGVILYTGSRDQHMTVELFRGRIRVSFDVGNYPVSTMFSYTKVSDGNEHRLELIVNRKNFSMKVDDGGMREIINEGPREYLNIDSPMFIGGLPKKEGQIAFDKWHVRNHYSFKGCLKEMYVSAGFGAGGIQPMTVMDEESSLTTMSTAMILQSTSLVDFLSARERHKTSEGCEERPQKIAAQSTELETIIPAEQEKTLPKLSAWQEQKKKLSVSSSLREKEKSRNSVTKHTLDSGACVSNRCKNDAKCVETSKSKYGYRCRCRDGFRGRFCDKRQKNVCRGRITRTVIKDPDGCASKHRIKSRQCQPTCQQGTIQKCCAPKYKRRQIKLYCTDGSVRFKQMKIVRKCQCSSNIPCGANARYNSSRRWYFASYSLL